MWSGRRGCWVRGSADRRMISQSREQPRIQLKHAAAARHTFIQKHSAWQLMQHTLLRKGLRLYVQVCVYLRLPVQGINDSFFTFYSSLKVFVIALDKNQLIFLIVNMHSITYFKHIKGKVHCKIQISHILTHLLFNTLKKKKISFSVAWKNFSSCSFFIKIRQRDKSIPLSPNKQYKHIMSTIFLKSYWAICYVQTDTEDVICWQPSHVLQLCLAASTQNLLWKVFTCYAFHFTKNSSWTSFCVPQKKKKIIRV